MKHYERIKRDGVIPGNSISTNDGIEEHSKFENSNKENEIKNLVIDQVIMIQREDKRSEINKIVNETKDQLAVPTEKKVNRNRIGTKLTNIKNIVTHEDVEGHRSALSEALLHQLHGPNEKVVFLSNDSDEDKLGHSIIETGHPHGQQLVVVPKTTDEHLPANYHLQQIGNKIAILPHTPEEKIQKLHLISSSIDPSLHQHQHTSGKVVVIRKAQEDALTNVHHIHSPSQGIYLLPKHGDETLLNIHEHAAAHQKVFLLPKTADPLLGSYHLQSAHDPHIHQDHHLHHGHHVLHNHHVLQSQHPHYDHHDLHSHLEHAVHHDLHSHHDHHSQQKYVILPKGHEDTLSHSLSSHHLGAHQLGTHTLGHNLQVHAHGDKLYELPKVTDETVAAINQLHSQSQLHAINHLHPQSPGVVLLQRTPEEKLSKLHQLQFGGTEVAYKPYGNGYTLPISPHLLSNMHIEHGRVPVVVSNMLGLTSAGPQSLVTHLHKNLQQQISKNILPQLIKHVKLADHHVDHKKHELDLGSAIHHHFTIIKKVGIPYIKPVPVQIEQRIPYPLIQRFPVLVDRPYKVHVIKPYPVLNPYLKNLEVPVKIPLSYPYKGPVVYNLPKSQFLVSKPDQLSKSILIQKSEPVLVKHERH